MTENTEMALLEKDTDYGFCGEGAEEALDNTWLSLAEKNVCDLPAKRAERIAELRAVLKKRNLHVKPDDDRQMLLLLRAGNCDPERAADVTKVFLDYKRTMLGSQLPSDFKDLMEKQKKNCWVLPGRDKHGRRVIYVKLWDKTSCTAEQFLMLGYLTSLVLGREPKTQVAGISVMVDLDGLSWKHVPSIKNLSTYLKLLSGGAPLHYRDIHWFNAPYIFKYCLKMVTPVLSKRILDCTYLYNSLDEAVKIAGGADMVPEEFGGSFVPMDGTPVFERVLAQEDYFKQLLESDAISEGTKSNL